MDDLGATWRVGSTNPNVVDVPGWNVQVVAETGSTNTDLLALAAAGVRDRTVLVARHQTAGRGRLDRRWEAPPGANLLVSLLFRSVPDHAHELTQRVALSALVAVERCAGVRATLKWPNDLLVVDGDLAGAKLAGVLAQAGVVDGRINHVVVGIGINVGWAPDGGTHLGARPAEHGGETVHPLALLAAMLYSYDELDDDVFAQYRARLGTLGQLVRVERPGDGPDTVLEGRAIDVGRDGRLAVLDECGVTHHIHTGDIIHLRHRRS